MRQSALRAGHLAAALRELAFALWAEKEAGWGSREQEQVCKFSTARAHVPLNLIAEFLSHSIKLGQNAHGSPAFGKAGASRRRYLNPERGFRCVSDPKRCEQMLVRYSA